MPGRDELGAGRCLPHPQQHASFCPAAVFDKQRILDGGAGHVSPAASFDSRWAISASRPSATC